MGGAGVCPNLVSIMNDARNWLINHNFTGDTYTLTKFSAAQANYLNTLATLLNGYNNTTACPAFVPMFVDIPFDGRGIIVILDAVELDGEHW